MEAVVNRRPSSEQDWLIYRAKGYLTSDISAAKACLITARTLFPRYFEIQFEAYSIEKTTGNVKKAAEYLEEIFQDFSGEAKLWTEVHAITNALQSEVLDSKTSFLRDTFHSLPTRIQHRMLLTVAERTPDTTEHIKLKLLLLNAFPDLVAEHGMKLVETLLMAEKHSHYTNPVNCYRKQLVSDILPLILKNPSIHLPIKQYYRLLQKSIEFYVSYITQPPCKEAIQVDDSSSVSKQVPGYSGGMMRQGSIQGLMEKEGTIENPWHLLFEIMAATGQKLGWELKDLFTSTNVKESQWQRLYSLHQRKVRTDDEFNLQHKQLLYCTTVLFLLCQHEYAVKMDPEQFTGSSTASNQRSPLVLIEGFKLNCDDESEEPKPKKKRSELKGSGHGMPHISVSKTISNTAAVADIVPTFMTTIKCWELLMSSDILEKDFQRLRQHLRMDSWPWFLSFQSDLLLHQGLFQECITSLEKQEASVQGHAVNKMKLQIATCLYCLGDLARACERILNVITSLPSTPGDTLTKHSLPVSNKQGRHLLILCLNKPDILQYCMQLMVTCFKNKVFSNKSQDDIALGHMIVLMQYDWPREEMLFLNAVEKIKHQGSFCYNIFFNYVINIDMLEEFAFLNREKVSLDLLPTSTAQIKQRTVTRGVNKGVKEDFRAAMERQVSRCDENIDQLLQQFFSLEKESILNILQ